MPAIRPPLFRTASETDLGSRAKMFSEQAVAQCGDRIADLLVALRFDRQVAFGIQAHRASAQVSRPDGEKLVVDDQNFAVNVEAGRSDCVTVVEPRAVNTIALMPVGADKVVVYTGAKHAHGRCLQPPALRRWRDDGDV